MTSTPIDEGGASAPQDTAKIIDRIKKLLALAESGNEHEAAAAAARAQSLLQLHQLEMAQIVGTVGRDSKGEIRMAHVPFLGAARAILAGKNPYGTVRSSWEVLLGGYVARAFFCEILYSQINLEFIGREVDLEVATYTYAVLAKRIEDLAQIRTREFGARYQEKYGVSYRHATGPSHPKAFRMSWIEGAVLGVAATLKEQSERFRNEHGKETAYALVSQRGEEVKAIRDQHSTGTFSTASNRTNIAARTAGYIEGKSMQIQAGIGEDSNPERLLRDS
jgi:hypothetical protein